MKNESVNAEMGGRQQDFERVLAREPFKGLKAILDSLSSDRQALCEAVYLTHSYEELLQKLGYRIDLTNQIHVQDCYSRVGGPNGAIRAVLPYYDIPTQSAFHTLVNRDSTVTTTAKSKDFFAKMLADLKAQLKIAN
jgi:hypothetical protein